jgi:hypothetical protein
MVKLLLGAAAAFAAFSVPSTPAQAEHVQASAITLHVAGHGGWRGDRGRDDRWRGDRWRGDRMWRHRQWRGDRWHRPPPRRWRGPPAMVWRQPWRDSCRGLWWDGWAWRCRW